MLTSPASTPCQAGEEDAASVYLYTMSKRSGCFWPWVQAAGRAAFVPLAQANEVRQCKLTVSKPVLKVPMVPALEATI
jgi:hypothetical protein